MTTTYVQVTPDTTPAAIRLAMTNLASTARRYGRYNPSYGKWHAEINRLSYILEERDKAATAAT